MVRVQAGEQIKNAIVAQLVERDLAKVEVAGSCPVYRSTCPFPFPLDQGAQNGLFKRHAGRSTVESSCRLHAEVAQLVECQPSKLDVAGSSPVFCSKIKQMSKVVHIKKEPYDVYIGRPSRWGNPYSHKDGTLAEFKVGSRREAISKYEEYLLQNEELMASLHELKGKILGCWCKPASCHGDILAKYANDNANKLF